ncbi:MAG: hypothetical protein KAH44_17700, partial [Oricola sp.]|nr:hypothetical protein [Oricola sp.]
KHFFHWPRVRSRHFQQRYQLAPARHGEGLRRLYRQDARRDQMLGWSVPQINQALTKNDLA